jgi:hypothetical protein
MSAASGVEVALFPLHTVLFPGGRLPLRIFEQRYMEMAKSCLKDGAPFGACLIAAGKEVGAPATPVEVGCLARIAHWDMPQLGLLQVMALGEQRFRILERRVEPGGLARARVELLAQEPDVALPERHRASARLLGRLLEEHAALAEPPHRLESGSWVGMRLAELLPLPLEVKQTLLEMDDPLERLDALGRVLANAQIRAGG